MADHPIIQPGPIAGAIAVIAAALIAAWSSLSGRNRRDKNEALSDVAAQQLALNSSFSAFMTEAHKKIGEQEAKMKQQEAKINSLIGEVRNLRQYNLSLADLLIKHGIDVPKPNFKSVALMFTNED